MSCPLVSWVVMVRPMTSLSRVKAPTGFSVVLTSWVSTRSSVIVVPRGMSTEATTIVVLFASGWLVVPPPPLPFPRT